MTTKLTIEQHFGGNLTTRRQKAGMSQEVLADRCGFSKSYVSMLERGLRSPRLDAIQRIAEALGVDAWMLLK